MASRKLKVIVSKKSEKQIKKAIDKIDETGVQVYGIKLGTKTVKGKSVSVLKILVEA